MMGHPIITSQTPLRRIFTHRVIQKNIGCVTSIVWVESKRSVVACDVCEDIGGDGF